MSKQDQYVKYLMDEYAEFPIDGTTYLWLYDNTELSYNTESNLEDLENGDGDTYSDYVQELEKFNGLTIFKMSDGCGGEYKIILKDSNRVEI